MAFPVPDHLPRKALAGKKYSLGESAAEPLLAKIADTPLDSLTSSIAQSWVSELTNAIDETKNQIHSRVEENLPDFERQLSSAYDVQARVQSLATKAEQLTETVNNPATGLIPVLAKRFAQHAVLEQQTKDADILAQAMDHVLQCRDHLHKLAALVRNADLAATPIESQALADLIRSAPASVQSSKTFAAIQNQYRIFVDQIQERVGHAYAEALQTTSIALIVMPSVTVAGSSRQISLPGIFSTLSETSLSERLASFRKEVLSRFVEPILTSQNTVTIGPGALLLSETSVSDPLDNLSTLVSFIHQQILVHYPPNQSRTQFPALYGLFTTQVLSFLQRTIPNTIANLPAYLDTVAKARSFEESIVQMGLTTGKQRVIAEWVDNVQSHYEKQRRDQILQRARVIVSDERKLAGSRVRRVRPTSPPEVVVASPAAASPLPTASQVTSSDLTVSPSGDGDESAWDFDDEPSGPSIPPPPPVGTLNAQSTATSVPAALSTPSTLSVEEFDEDGWGFDDNDEPVADPPPASLPAMEPESNVSTTTAPPPEAEEDPWDDGWDDSPQPEDPSPPPPSQPAAPRSPSPPPIIATPIPRAAKRLEKFGARGRQTSSASTASSIGVLNAAASSSTTLVSPSEDERSASPASITAPKVAKRLERFGAKGKSKTLGNGALNANTSVLSSDASRSRTSSPAPASTSTLPPESTLRNSQPPLRAPAPIPAPIVVRPKEEVIEESYLVSECAKSVLELCRETVTEGRGLKQARIFPTTSDENVGGVILSSIVSVFDLFRALFPVAHAAMINMSPSLRIRLSNDCVFLAAEVAKLADAQPDGEEVSKKLREVSGLLTNFGEGYFDDCLEEQRTEVFSILDPTDGFFSTGDDGRYEICENAVRNALQTIISIAQDWKTTLPLSSYFEAVGFLVEETLSRVLSEILALPDIPEVDSHRLNALCRILDAVKDLFVETPGTDSTVGIHVPSWFKFAYISELMEASLADITYLFESGALVDFETDELVRLIQGLFSETPLRAKTIDKIMAGQPEFTMRDE